MSFFLRLIMIDLNSINLNKVRNSVQTPRQGTAKPQDVNFNALLFELKMKQIESWGALLGGEPSTRPDTMSGYQDLLMNSLASLGVKNGLQLKQGIKNYQANEGSPVSIPAQPVKAGAIRDWVSDSAQKYGIPGQWFEKLIQQESAFDPAALSPKGAMGLGQLMPSTARDLGLRVGPSQDRSEGSVWHPVSNLNASARYLRQLYDRYAGMGIEESEAWKFAAGAYNAGMGNIQKAIDIVDTEEPLKWEKVAGVLDQVTGKNSQETIQYVRKL